MAAKRSKSKKRSKSTGRKKARTPAQRRATEAMIAANKNRKKGGGKKRKSKAKHAMPNPWSFKGEETHTNHTPAHRGPRPHPWALPHHAKNPWAYT